MAQANIDSSTLGVAVAKQNEQSSVAIDAITAANKEIGSLSAVRAQAVVDAADAEATEKTVAAVGEMKSQQATLKAATVIGTNTDDISELITSLGMKSRESFDAAAKAREEYFKKKNTSFFDSPLEYISNELLGGTNSAANEYNRHALEYNATTERLKEIADLTSAHALAQKAIRQTINAGSIEAMQVQIAKKAIGDAAQIKQQNLVYNIQGMEAVVRMNAAQLDSYFKLNSAVMSEKHLGIAYAQLEQSRKIHEATIAERNDRIAEKKADRKEIEATNSTMNVGREAMGLAPLPLGRGIQLLNMKGELGDVARDHFVMGAQIEDGGRMVISENAGKTARIISSTNAPLAPAALPIKKLLDDSLTQALSNKRLDKKDPNAIDKATTEIVAGITATMAANIKAGDGANIYQAPDMGVLSKIPAVAESVLYKKVLAPAVEAGVINTDPALIVNQAANAVATRQITFKEAQDGIKQIFKSAVALNIANKDYTRYGKGVTPQTTYITILPSYVGNFREKSQAVDLTSDIGISGVLSRRLSATFNPLNSPANQR